MGVDKAMNYSMGGVNTRRFCPPRGGYPVKVLTYIYFLDFIAQ